MALTYADLVTQAGTNPYAPLTYATQNQRVTPTKPKAQTPTTPTAYTATANTDSLANDYFPSFNYSVPFNLSPQPTSGQGAYGSVPGPVGVPPNLWEQIGNVYPAADQLGQASGVIGNQLAGQLSPEEIAAYQTYGAQFGVGRGTPLSTFSGQAGLLNVGRGVAATQQEGLSNYERMLGSLSGLMTPQNLATDIAERNALMAAAPDPKAAAEQQMQDFMDKWRMAQESASAGPQQGTITRGPTSITPPPATMPTFQTGGGGGGGYVQPRTYTSDVYNPAGAYDRWAQSVAGTGLGLAPLTYGGGSMPAATYYDPTTDTSRYDPYAEFGGYNLGVQPTSSGYMYMGPNYEYGGDTYGGDTYYNPIADTSSYDPYAGFGGYDLGYNDVSAYPGWYEQFGIYE